ncbi:MAG: NAD(P)-dependent oxidoreductase [Methylacidiphilales bacterium]|nr:NAD(P)-dependent oxidoreductase [Candidatus Methylacidiphilales bacterium]
MRVTAVLLDKNNLGTGVSLAKIASVTKLTVWGKTSPDLVIPRLRNAEIAITNKVQLNKETLSHCKKLKHICLLATGTNNIDIDYCKKHGVGVWPVKNYSQNSVAIHAFSMALALHQELITFREKLQAGAWSQSKHFCLFQPSIETLAGKTIGIIGYGAIGKRVARLAKAFSMKIIISQRDDISDKRKGRKSVDYLFQHCDIISLHCPLTAYNQTLVSAKRIKSMKRGAILINCSRGGLIDEKALASALNKGLIKAGLDVLSEEPPPQNHPLLLLKLPNLIITPHVAWIPLATRQRLVDLMTEQVKRAIKTIK